MCLVSPLTGNLAPRTLPVTALRTLVLRLREIAQAFGHRGLNVRAVSLVPSLRKLST
jgi:hypothetical protein